MQFATDRPHRREPKGTRRSAPDALPTAGLSAEQQQRPINANSGRLSDQPEQQHVHRPGQRAVQRELPERAESACLCVTREQLERQCPDINYGSGY